MQCVRCWTLLAANWLLGTGHHARALRVTHCTMCPAHSPAEQRQYSHTWHQASGGASSALCAAMVLQWLQDNLGVRGKANMAAWAAAGVAAYVLWWLPQQRDAAQRKVCVCMNVGCVRMGDAAAGWYGPSVPPSCHIGSRRRLLKSGRRATRSKADRRPALLPSAEQLGTVDDRMLSSSTVVVSLMRL